MCMGCAGSVILYKNGEATDTTETIIYLCVLSLWFVLLIHLNKKWVLK